MAFISENSTDYELGHTLGVAIRYLGTVGMLILMVHRFRKPTIL
jgi:hypothetical protein